MNDNNSASDDKSVSGVSYVDAYQPPSSDPNSDPVDPIDNLQMNDPISADPQSTPAADMNESSQPMQPVQPTEPTQSDQPTNEPAQTAQPTEPVQAAQPTQSAQSPESNTSESLEDQNIFFLLGVSDGTDEQKEKFLDELQQVIWEDFLEYDVKLLITSEEQAQLQAMIKPDQDQTLEQQEEIVTFLEKLIPDLEEIMLEKALELKEEMVRERAAGLRTYHADKPDNIKRIDEAERLMDQGSWYSAAHAMNSLV